MLRRAFLSMFGVLAAAPTLIAASESGSVQADAEKISETSGKPLKRVERWDVEKGEWVRVRMKNLAVGDRVRMDDATGEFRVTQSPNYDPESKVCGCQAERWPEGLLSGRKPRDGE